MTERQNQVWYAAFKAKDARFDGCFFVGISSTGIYCRPICRAKLPRFENCTFHLSAAAAERAGFRPCLLCRPELAPGAAPVDAASSLAFRAAELLEAQCGDNRSVEELAARLGCTSRHLRRVFAAQYGVSPVRYLQTGRLLLAKNLLTGTRLSVIEAATAAGFGSLRRFNDLFRKQYRLTPTALRRGNPGGAKPPDGVTLMLGYRPPYQWKQIWEFLAQRAIPGVETAEAEEYCRTVSLTAGKRRQVGGWIRIGDRPRENQLAVTMDPALLPVLPQVLARVRRLFDLYCNPEAVYEVLASMNGIRPGLCVPGTRLPGCFDVFEMAVRAVLGQQITVKGARTLAGRLAEAYGTPVQTGIAGLTRMFPAPETILGLDGPIENRLGPLGITRTRANTIRELARAFAEKAFDSCSPPEETVRKLMEIPGIGSWTAQYIAMRALGWPDAFPHTDYGVRKALAPRTVDEISALVETWRPWRGYATVNLWNSL